MRHTVIGEWRKSTDVKLDAAAVITEADVADTMRRVRERSPELARLLEATREDVDEHRPKQRDE